MPTPQETVFIASPLEAEHVERIRAAFPSTVRVVHEPDLLPPTRYIADHKGIDDYRRTAEQEERWRRHLSEATILWDFPTAGADGAGAGLEYAPKVKWVQTTSSGVGKLIEGLGLINHPVLVTTARGVHATPLAEFVIMSLLIHVKQLDHLYDEQRHHRWNRYCGRDLPGMTMAVIGAGKVGSEVGRLAKAFGMRVLSVVNRPSPNRAAALHADTVMGPDCLGDAVAAADCVTLCTPHTPETENMVDAGIIARMKPDAVLVNIARGQVVDEQALIEALRQRRIGFAALDVAATEPLPSTSPLWDMDNVLISPHSASTVESENARITNIFLNNLKYFISGDIDLMENILDKKRLY